MKFLAAFLFALFAIAPAPAAERTYTVTDFDRISVEGPYRVTVTTGSASRARATGPSLAALDRLRLDVEGGTLRIRTARETWTGPGANGPVEIKVTTRQLRAVALSGSGHLSVAGAKGLHFDLIVSGSGTADIGGIAVDRLNVVVIGSGAARLSGTAKLADARVEGSAGFDAAGLNVDDLKIGAATAGEITALARRTAKVVSRGSGDIRIGGRPACTITAEGAGLVTCGAASR
ncbi:DUF2807 domain-containing protein [Allosphingosinicella flava]|uniref:DUF2807 domain-containing protein n=1 Tax=Allosphingosinicella flava TaxID=2771430 RepID=A0A7T2GJK7_9SPHN|nr:head GIN domain-containing protein [Sphingosinicella flava]QPQ54693.1 DUF2807 domain-containing protein [Sphingosinicella flava]